MPFCEMCGDPIGGWYGPDVISETDLREQLEALLERSREAMATGTAAEIAADELARFRQRWGVRHDA